MELRCSHKLHGVITEPADAGELELKCGSRFCGAATGVVVLHTFDLATGELISTNRYRDTPVINKGR